jgi:hypothetical protein
MPQEESAVLPLNVPYVKLRLHNRIFLYPKANGYGDNDARKMWSCSSLTNVIRTLHKSVFEPIDKPRHTKTSVSGKVLGTVRAISMKQCDFLA